MGSSLKKGKTAKSGSWVSKWCELANKAVQEKLKRAVFFITKPISVKFSNKEHSYSGIPIKCNSWHCYGRI